MKQHNKYNDEELFQQIMDELMTGAEEYDRLLAEGKNPASKSKVALPIYKYVAAACIGFAFIGASLYMFINGEKNSQLPMDEVTASIVIGEKETENYTLTNAEDESHDIADKSIAKTSKPKTKHKRTVRVNQNISNDAEADEREQEFLYALITEVENNILTEQKEEELLYNSIIDEVTSNISNESKKPELNL